MFLRLKSLISLDEIGGVHIFHWLPSVITVWITFPFDKVLELAPMPMQVVIDDIFDFKFLFPLNQVGWWSQEVRSMRGRLSIVC